ncbi:MAG: SIMPL domain-containing protein [Ahrensia sp.]|nr:SIMPL domain-containing protein [Ahrensia sp.]
MTVKSLFVSLVAILALAMSPAFGAETKPATITVTASGSASAAPDLAILNLTVLREGKTAREALDANTAAMAAVLSAMKAEGIADRDLQTSNFNIQPQLVYPKRASDGSRPEPKIVGYIVTNALTVRLRDLTRLGAVLDQSVTLGVNSGGNISFQHDDPTKLLSEAREKAVKAAIAKAETLTRSAGVSLGRILDISEQSRGQPRPVAMARMAAAEAVAADVPIASGESRYEITVSMRWEIAQ